MSTKKVINITIDKKEYKEKQLNLYNTITSIQILLRKLHILASNLFIFT